jgi:hypothetical protein
MVKLKLRDTAIALLALGSAQEAFAQSVAAPETVKYPRAFFDAFSPTTAFDIVRRVPGFTLDLGQDRRGFGSSGGNVLIDGKRPASKSGGLEEALARIPASTVERVELILSEASSEAQGQSVVVNLVLKPALKTSVWQVGASLDREGALSPSLEATVSRPLAGWLTSTRLVLGAGRDPNDGTRTVRDGSGGLIRSEVERRDSLQKWLNISSEARGALAGGELTVNSRLEGYTYEMNAGRDRFLARRPDGAPDQARFIDFNDKGVNGEFGLDWSRQMTPRWTLRALTLATWDDTETRTVSRLEAPVGAFSSGQRARSTSETIEWIGRSVASGQLGSGLKVEIGGELVFNRLDAGLDFADLTSQGQGVPINLPSANVRVEERRAEAFVSAGMGLGPRVSVEGLLSFETSRINVSGEASAAETLSDFKPAVSLSWRASNDFTVRLDLRREVGQLDFDGFAASAEIAADRTAAGNPQLRPDSVIRSSINLDYRKPEGPSTSFEAFHEWRSDILEQLVLPSGAVATVNAGDARVWGVRVSAASPLPGGFRLEGGGEWRDSQFRDPLTGGTRVVNTFTPLTYRVELRQDVPAWKLSWGLVANSEGTKREFFVGETSEFNLGVRHNLYIETTRWPGLKVRLTLSDFTQRRFQSERRFFEPNRAGRDSGREIRNWDRGPDISLRINGQF